jgi:hypothetical protein
VKEISSHFRIATANLFKVDVARKVLASPC